MGVLRRRSPEARVGMVLLGAIPAVLLVVMATTLAMLAVTMIFSSGNRWLGIAMLLWGLAGIAGTVSGFLVYRSFRIATKSERIIHTILISSGIVSALIAGRLFYEGWLLVIAVPPSAVGLLLVYQMWQDARADRPRRTA